MQTNSNVPVLTFPGVTEATQVDAHEWVVDMAKEIYQLQVLEKRKADLQEALEKIDDEIFEQSERCRITISA